VVWIALSLLFNVAFYAYAQYAQADDPRLLLEPGFDSTAAARQVALEFLADYVVEHTLSIDNMFVFVVVFTFVRVAARAATPRVVLRASSIGCEFAKPGAGRDF
jgi:tellurite resistance protein TerC